MSAEILERAKRRTRKIRVSIPTSKDMEQMVKEVSKELNLDLNVVRAVFNSQYDLISKVIGSADINDTGSFLNIRTYYLGTFVFLQKKYDQLKTKSKKNRIIRDTYYKIADARTNQNGSDNSQS